jgi:hypothetical protein
MGGPTSSYATAGIALKVSAAFKPHHHNKVEAPSMGVFNVNYNKTEYNQNQSLVLGFQ